MSRSISAATAAAALAFATPLLAQGAPPTPTLPPPRIANAQPRSTPIVLDARLDEAAWQAVQPLTDFTQSQPNEGEPATQRTEIRFLTDDDYLYIGARMFDTEGASGVRTRLARRDQDPGTDYIHFVFDTFHDHLGRVIIRVNPSGVKLDSYGPGGSTPDPSWNAVWDVETRVDSLGWTAEFRIPFAQLRYPRDSVQTWGLQVWRLEARLNELSSWVFWHLNQTGGPPLFGHLENLRVVRGPGRGEVMPYVVGRSTNVHGEADDPFYDPHVLDARTGLDLKYNLTSNMTLSATFNPDFGQVEVDPAVVNLTAFETYFPEQRPFFVEGAGLFSFGTLNCYSCSYVFNPQLFYSRRVGRRPQGEDIARQSGRYADIPENTTILGAAKLTGRLASGVSLALSNAVTRRERAPVQVDSATRRYVEAEPLSNYFVARLARDFAGGNGQIRMMATSVVRDLGDSALATRLVRRAEAGGVEGEYWWKRHTYRIVARALFSSVVGDSTAILSLQRSSARYFQRPDRHQGSNGLFSSRYDSSLTAMRGYGLYARLSKESGDWLWEAQTNVVSPGFETNDAGYMTRSDRVWMGASVLRQFTRPNRFARNMVFLANAEQGFNYDGDLTYRSAMGYVSFTFHNYWSVDGFAMYRPSVLDDRLARSGPVLRQPASWIGYAELYSDTRKAVSLSLGEQVVRSDGQWSVSHTSAVTWRPTSSVSVSLGPSLDVSRGRNQWVTKAPDPTAAAFYGWRYVFADIAQNTLSMDTRLSVTFTPNLTLELYAQPLVASASYTRFKEYARPRSLESSVFVPRRGTAQEVGTVTTADDGRYEVDPDGTGPAAAFRFANPDFNYRSLRGNAVLRWEFKPGSTVFLVWTQSREGSGPEGNLRLGRDTRALLDSRPDNIFLVKMSYWMGF